MGWMYLDDKFPEHPKVEAAGGPAAWLYICGLAYARRNDTQGVIPKNRVARLTDARRPLELALRLVEVALWHDTGDAYEINDYGMWNAKAEKRSAQAKAAAQKRWHAEKSATETLRNGVRPHMREHMQPHMPEHDDEQCDRMTHMGMDKESPTPSPSPTPSFVSSVSESSSSNRGASEEEERRSAIVNTLVERRLARRTPTAQPIVDPAKFRASVAAAIERDFGGELWLVVRQCPDATIAELANMLEPPSNGTSPHPLDAAAVAAKALRERDRSCPDCGGTGMVETDDGAVRCQHTTEATA